MGRSNIRLHGLTATLRNLFHKPGNAPAISRKATLVAHGAVLCAALVSGHAQADAVTDWNEITMTAVAAGRPGPVGQLDVALVQVAVHDAVQAIEHRFEPYFAEIRNAQGSRSAAVAAATRAMLIGLYPAQAATVDAAYYNYIATHGLQSDPGLTVGEQVAAKMLPLRRMPPEPAAAPYVGSNEPGAWRPTDSFLGTPPTPAPFSPMATPWMAKTDPFTLTGAARFRVGPPPALTSAQYTKDYEEVKKMGSLMSTVRTPAQTDLAYFFTDNIFALWNRTLRGVATTYVPRIGDSARLFALANMAMADGVITTWDSKMTYSFWRPLTAIREGDNDGNPTTMGDPNWQPLGNNPNYPDYTSGVNIVTAAAARTLERFFGTDRLPFQMTTMAPAATQKTRNYWRFSDVARDTVEARVYLGIHFRFADTAGREQGIQVADWATSHFLRPLRWDGRKH